MPPLLEQLLAGYHDTQDRWSVADDDGARIYVEERAQLHERWLAEELSGTPLGADEQPVALVLAGGPASGKSTLREHLDLPDSYTLIDPDRFKRRIPEYVELVDANEPRAAEVVHEESSDLAAELRRRAMNARHNLVFDQTGAGPRGHFVGKLRRLAEHGYRVEVVYADAPVDVAIERDQQRFRKTGRLVGASLIRRLHREVAASYPEVVHDPLVSSVRLYDCSGGTGCLIAESGATEATVVHDRDKLEAFMAKAEM